MSVYGVAGFMWGHHCHTCVPSTGLSIFNRAGIDAIAWSGNVGLYKALTLGKNLDTVLKVALQCSVCLLIDV